MFLQKGASRLARPQPGSLARTQVATPHMWIWRAVIVIGWALVVTSLVMFAWELLHWMQNGTWRSISLAKMVHLPNLDRGADMGSSYLDCLHGVFRWFVRMPAVVMLFVGGLICSWRANDLHTRAELQAKPLRPMPR